MKFLTSGKVKDIYEYGPDTILFKFSDRVSAYDVKFKEEIPKKGEVLCKFAEFWFNEISASNHFIKRTSDTEIIVKKMKMLPIECVVRGYFYGSIINRWKNNQVSLPAHASTELAAKLPSPIFDPTTKSERDIPVDKKKCIEMGLVSDNEFEWLSENSIKIYKMMASKVENAGFILADLKLEFGILDGKITLGDSIGPDEYRLWLKNDYEIGKTQEAYDKQILRDWLTSEGYQKKFDDDRNRGISPSPPLIPISIIEKMTQRYVVAFEKITGQPL